MIGVPEGRSKILNLFFKDPFTEIHLREIARLSRVSRSSVEQNMRLFVQENMFMKKVVANMTFFKPNLGNQQLLKLFEYIEIERRERFFDENKKIARLLKKYAEKIIINSNNKIQMIILFGSVARGEWTKNSDIDILAVCSEKDKSITAVLAEAKIEVSPLLEINPITTTIEKFREGIRKKLEFYDEIWSDRIVLYNEFLFWQLVKEGSSANAQSS